MDSDNVKSGGVWRTLEEPFPERFGGGGYGSCRGRHATKVKETERWCPGQEMIGRFEA